MATINIIQQSTPQQIRLIQEDISDQLGSSNVVFMVGQNFISGTLQVFLNGLSMRLDSDFNEIGTQSFRFINYDSSFIRTINSPSSTLAVKYFKYFEPSDPSPSSLSIFSDDSSDGEDDIVKLFGSIFVITLTYWLIDPTEETMSVFPAETVLPILSEA